MHRIHPTNSSEISSDTGLSDLSEGESVSKRLKVEKFSWNSALAYAKTQFNSFLGRPTLYFIDGCVIRDESFLESMTKHVCQEYGLQLLDVIADLILPVGFDYPSITTELQDIVENAFKPLGKIGPQKLLVWIEDDSVESASCLLETFVRQLLVKNAEPFLLAPHYFDKEALGMLAGTLSPVEGENGQPQKRMDWSQFSTLLRFGYLLLLRTSNCPFIVIHLRKEVVEKVDAFRFLDLAESEGHKVMFLKNVWSNPKEMQHIVQNFVEKLITMKPVAATVTNKHKLNSLDKEASTTAVGYTVENMSLDEYLLLN